MLKTKDLKIIIGGPAYAHDSLIPAPQPELGTGTTKLLDSNEKADGRQVNSIPSTHLQDMCTVTTLHLALL